MAASQIRAVMSFEAEESCRPSRGENTILKTASVCPASASKRAPALTFQISMLPVIQAGSHAAALAKKRNGVDT